MLQQNLETDECNTSLGHESASPESGIASLTLSSCSTGGGTETGSPEYGTMSSGCSLRHSPKQDASQQSLSFVNSGNNSDAKPSASPRLQKSNAEPPVPPSPTGVKLTTIKIHHPSKVTVLYDRRTWPVPQRVLPPTETFDCAEEALDSISEDNSTLEDADSSASSLSPRSPTLKEVVFKPHFKQHFSVAFNFLEGAVTEKSPLLKLQHLTACLREISQQVSAIHRQLGAQVVGACTDDLIDILVILLCNCSSDLVVRIYPHIMLLTDLMPPFFEGGPYSFSLVQFSVALEFLQDRLVMKRRSS